MIAAKTTPESPSKKNTGKEKEKVATGSSVETSLEPSSTTKASSRARNTRSKK